MRFSKFFIHTLKETPKDVVLKSHEYLIRGGFISQSGSGIYNLLPLSKIVLEKISNIVRLNMNKAGANEVLLGCITPASLWQSSGRYERYGKELLRLKDRKDNDFVFGPTHEETITDLTKNYIKSYKQLPIHLYQIQTKFRDEIRPRFGLMRAREFIMKDGYSFHNSHESLKLEFDKMEQTYTDIFNDLGLNFRVVEADSGAIGGNGSKEFMVLANSGEDTICVCDSCKYGANLEIASRKPNLPASESPEASFAKFHTPNTKTIDSLCEFFKIDSYWTIKAVVKKAIFDNGVIEFVFFFLRGSDSLNETKALNVVGANELCDATEDEIRELGLFSGYIGPYALRNITGAKHIYFDNELKAASNMICGANEPDYHFVGVDLNLFEGLEFKELLEVKEGDKCPRCNDGKLYFTRGIEVGHIFQLGDKYSKAMNTTFLDENGKAQPYVMGCYGIGISRLIAAIIEQHHDDRGMKWTKSTAPFLVDIIISNIKDSDQVSSAENIYNSLISLGVETILDDRNERYGAKMADFELIGFPYAIIVGKGIQEGKVELVNRDNLEKKEYELSKIEDLLEELKKCL